MHCCRCYADFIGYIICVSFCCLNFVSSSFSSREELLYFECLQNIGLGQYENQNASNHDFCQSFVDFKVIGIRPLAPVQNSVTLKLMQCKTLNFVINVPDVENITK